MKYNPRKALQSFHNIKEMLKGLPEALWEVFLPLSEADLPRLETNILALKARAMDREKVISMQRLCGLPLRPNESLHETAIKVRLQGKMKDKLYRKYKKNRKDFDGGELYL